MLGKLTGVMTALAAVVVVMLALPSGALACGGGGTSATAVYVECLPSAGGGKTAGSTSGEPPVPISKGVAQALSHAAKSGKTDTKALQKLVSDPSFGSTRGLSSVPASAVVAPTTLSAVFDLGAGPIALIAILGGTALILLASTGWRGWRRWRRPLA